MALLSRPSDALLAGVLIVALVLAAVWLLAPRVDLLGLVSFLARFVHVFAAMLWVGMVWFVNFIQLAALAAADDAGRAALMRHVVPSVAGTFRHASHLVLASGIVLLVTNGYVLDRWVFPSAVYIPTLRGSLLWSGALAGIVMWGLVHFVIWPALSVVLDPAAEPAARAAARDRAAAAARINLVLSVPATFVMIAAAHLY